jgi:F-type H+-transporting ATPase subunit a
VEHIFEELAPHAVAHWPKVFGIDMSPTTHTVFLFISLFVSFLLVWLGARKMQLVPTGWQNVVESLLDFIRTNIVFDIIGPDAAAWFPFIATLFIFILVSNLIGLIPGAKTATSITSTTASWALIVFLAYNFVGIKKKGVIKYFRSFVPHGVPLWLAPIMFVLEFISHLLRPFSLAVRLFANMTAGHLVIGIFTMFAMQIALIPLKGVPIAAVVIILMFELFVSAIQAYIFAVLAAIYVSGAVGEEH